MLVIVLLPVRLTLLFPLLRRERKRIHRAVGPGRPTNSFGLAPLDKSLSASFGYPNNFR
jgi:hypothetical protein